MVMDDLYRDAATDASGDASSDASGGTSDAPVETSFLFNEETLLTALRRIYGGKLDVSKEIEEHLWEEIYRILSEACTEGLSESSAEVAPEFLTLVDYHTAAFSAFKVHRMQNDMAAQLHDSNGNLKPFEQWSKDVQPIAGHHVGTWLETEYNTAVIRMQQAADWQRFLENADILPCLEWMPSTSAYPGADHRIFWHTILPVGHPFWNRHRPGDRWNCKCWLRNTDAPATAVPEDSGEPSDAPSPGLDNNPGVDGKLFGDTHPYIAHGYDNAAPAVEQFIKERKELP